MIKRIYVCVYIYIYICHFAVQQKLREHYKSTITKYLKNKNKITMVIDGKKKNT